jgi:hypothetical protein
VSATAPGWYPDPYRRHESRYWDGGRWTEHVSDAGSAAVDPTEWGASASTEPVAAEPPPLAAEPPPIPTYEPTTSTPPPAWGTPPSTPPPAWGSPPPAPSWAPAARPAVDTRDRVPAIVGLVAAAVLLVSAFLPWFEVSIEFAGVSASETVSGIDGSDGVIIIAFAVAAGVLALLRILGKGAPQVGIGMAIVGLLATIIGLVDLGNKDPDTDAPLAALAEVDPSVGLWLVILAGLVVAVTGVLIVLSGRSRPAVA